MVFISRKKYRECAYISDTYKSKMCVSVCASYDRICNQIEENQCAGFRNGHNSGSEYHFLMKLSGFFIDG